MAMIGPIYQDFLGNKGSIGVLSRYSWIKTKLFHSRVWRVNRLSLRHMGLGNMKGYSIVQEAIHYLRL